MRHDTCLSNFDQSSPPDALTLKDGRFLPPRKSPGIKSHRTGIARNFDSEGRVVVLEAIFITLVPRNSGQIDSENNSFERNPGISGAGLRLVTARDSDVG